MNDKALETRAQEQTKAMLPKLREGVYKLYTRIGHANFNQSSNSLEVVDFAQEIRASLN